MYTGGIREFNQQQYRNIMGYVTSTIWLMISLVIHPISWESSNVTCISNPHSRGPGLMTIPLYDPIWIYKIIQSIFSPWQSMAHMMFGMPGKNGIPVHDANPQYTKASATAEPDVS